MKVGLVPRDEMSLGTRLELPGGREPQAAVTAIIPEAEDEHATAADCQRGAIALGSTFFGTAAPVILEGIVAGLLQMQK